MIRIPQNLEVGTGHVLKDVHEYGEKPRDYITPCCGVIQTWSGAGPATGPVVVFLRDMGDYQKPELVAQIEGNIHPSHLAGYLG